MKKILVMLLSAALLVALSGCSATEARQDGTATEDVEGQLTFTERDRDASYDAATATTVELADNAITIEGTGAQATGSNLVITEEGTYILRGTLGDGSVTVELPGDDDKAQVVLDGASIHNEDGPALLVSQADKVFVTLADGSSNVLSDGANREVADDEEEVSHKAALFSKDDLTINGTGALEVTGNYYHGIASKDDLVITGGTLRVTSSQDGLRGNDAIKIGGGNITVNAGDDAFHSEYLFFIEDGTVNVESCVEGYEAEKIYIRGGESSIVASDDGVNASAADTEEDDGTAETPAEMTTPEGEQPTMPQGQDGRMGDAPMEPDGQRPDMPGGQGGQRPQMPDGGGAEPPAMPEDRDMGAGRPDMQGKGGIAMTAANASEECLIQIDGGTLVVDAGGDGLDSNGYIEINGGTVLVSGASSADDSGLDYEYGATVNGGDVILVGSAGMAEDFTGGTQAHLMERLSGDAGSTVEVKDAAGNVLVSYIVPKAFQAVTASAPGATSISVR